MIAVSIGVSLSVSAQGGKSNDRVVHLMAGKADTVELTSAVADVLVANPAVADVGTLRSNRLYIVGRAVGDTNVLAYDSVGNQLANITVRVRMDDRNLQDTLREFFPGEKISARTVRENVVLSGTVSSAGVSNQVRDLAARFITDRTQTLVDLMTIRGAQQVMLKVKVIEAKRSALRDLGIETDYRAAATDGFEFDSGLAGVGAGDIGRSTILPFGAGGLLVGEGGTFGQVSAVLRALETNGIVNVLAEPNLTAISGETAGFLAGGEFPVPTGRDTQGNILIEFKQFGVSLNFTPTVLSKDRIALHLSTEVSERDTVNSVTLSDLQIPGLSVRRAETTLELGSGSTIMMAGLIKSDTLQTMTGFPGVQELPILGRLFKSDSFRRNESELLIIVTPYLVNSYAEPDAVVEAVVPTVLEKRLKKFSENTPGKVPARMGAAKAQPVQMESTASVVTAQAVAANSPFAGTGNPLSQRLIKNLKNAYGNHVPEKIGSSGGFGYIVD